MNLLRKLSDLTVAEKQEINNHLWIRKYAKKRRMEIQAKNGSSYEIAGWRGIELHEAEAITDLLMVQQ